MIRELSVIIPAYNESHRIVFTLRELKRYLDSEKYDYEIIVVNDGSKDNTAELVKQLGFAKIITNSPNRGKGYSIKRGMLAAKKKWILFTDADLSIPISELRNFEKYKESYDIIIGSKHLPDANIKVQQPTYRKIPGKVFAALVRLFFLKDIMDSQCGFKLFSKESAKKLFSKQTISGFGFDVEILYLAQKYYKYRIKEVPITLINNKYSRLIVIRDSFKMFSDITRVFINELKGKYL